MIKKSINKYHFDPDDKIFKDVLIDGSFSPHLGYPNLFPIAFGFVDPTKTDILDSYVNMIKKELWTNHGLRSLSINDNHFGKVIDIIKYYRETIIGLDQFGYQLII